MNIQFYIEKLKSSEEFRNFIKENPSVFLCSAFFSFDKKGKDNKQHLDFFSNGKIISFQLENNCKKVMLENFSNETPSEISQKTDFELNKIEELILEKIKTEKIKDTLHKMLISLQNIDGKLSAAGTAFISGMGMINFLIDLEKMKIIKFEKKSIFDMINILKK
jgi:hypothetical protein